MCMRIWVYPTTELLSLIGYGFPTRTARIFLGLYYSPGALALPNILAILFFLHYLTEHILLARAMTFASLH